MIKAILGFLGYSKIPIEAVQLSMINEHAWSVMVEKYPDAPETRKLYEGAKAMTEFLRSGKVLN